MKKLFTVDTIVASLFGAIGYGAGYVIPTYYGVNTIFSIVICMVVGTICDLIGNNLVFNRAVQKSRVKKHAVFIDMALVFLMAYYVIAKLYAHSLFSDLGLQLAFVIGIPVISFFISVGIRFIKRRRLYKKYGSGEKGFLFDQEVKEAMKELSGENKQLSKYKGKNPVIKTSSGTYVGLKDRNTISFLGISYATAKRWEKPVPVEDSENIYEAYYFGDCEIQPESNHNVLNYFKQSEDCLNLNIWMSKLEPEAKKPVLVYIHGGDGRYGGSSNPTYHLTTIAANIPDAIFVSINYRLGLFGVVDFSTTGCVDANEYPDSTALSLLDQIEALKWIKKNISAFGGDPENITIAGDTAGGSCICMLTALKDAKEYFKRALILSASSQDTPIDSQIASQLGKTLLEEFHANSIADLKKLTTKQLREFSSRHYDLLETPPKDGRLIPQDIEKAYLNGAASGIDFIFGFAVDDINTWQAFLVGEVSVDDITKNYYENLKCFVGKEKEDKVDELLNKYIQSGLTIAEAKNALLADMNYKAYVLHDCKTLSKTGSSVRCFCWDVKGDIEKLTANTVSMVTAILGNSEIAEQMGYLHDYNITEITQTLINKYIHKQPIELFNNELKGVSEIVWDELNSDKQCVLHIQKDKIEMTDNAFSYNVYELEKLLPYKLVDNSNK